MLTGEDGRSTITAGTFADTPASETHRKLATTTAGPDTSGGRGIDGYRAVIGRGDEVEKNEGAKLEGGR